MTFSSLISPITQAVLWVCTPFYKFVWLWRKTVPFHRLAFGVVAGLAILIYRMLHQGVNLLLENVRHLQTVLDDVNSGGISTIGDILDCANYLFPVGELFSMYVALLSIGVACISLRVVRAFIPTMT